MERHRGSDRGRRVLGALLVAAALSSGCSDDSGGSDPELEEFGGTPPSAAELATYPKALPATAFAPPPVDAVARLGSGAVPASFVIPESSLPPVQAQGTATSLGYPGSCEVWSAGYAMGSYAANLTNHADIKNVANTVSAAYVYMTVLAEEQKSCGNGTAPAGALNYLVSSTAPSLASIPYYPVCECTPGSDQCLESITLDRSCATSPELCTDLSIGSWSGFDHDPVSQTLELIKSWVAQRHVVQTTIVVPFGFGEYTSGVFDAPTSCPSGSKCALFHGIACGSSTKTPSGCAQHGVAIVGYDDALGAVKIQNSFGPSWGEDGYIWMSYATLESIYLAGTVAFAPPARSAATAAALEGTRAAAERGFQSVERRADEEPLRLGEITITTPDGTSLTHDYGGHAFRSGHHYVTRHDRRQFEAGAYGVRLTGIERDGATRVLESTVDVALAAGETLPAAPPGDDVTGTNGAPVR